MAMETEIAIAIRAKDEASRTLKGVTGTIQGMSKQLKIAGGVMAGFGATITAGFGMAVKQFAEAGDEVQKMALRTGFSTEALSEFRHAAELSGTSLNGLETGVRRMQKLIVDASDGLTEATDAFDRIGLSWESLKGLSPEEQFDNIIRKTVEQTQKGAEEIEKAADETKKALAGMAHETGQAFEQTNKTIAEQIGLLDTLRAQVGVGSGRAEELMKYQLYNYPNTEAYREAIRGMGNVWTGIGWYSEEEAAHLGIEAQPLPHEPGGKSPLEYQAENYPEGYAKEWAKEQLEREADKYQHGGVVQETGLAYVHKGETVVPPYKEVIRERVLAPIQIMLNGRVVGEEMMQFISDHVGLQGGMR